MSSKNSNSRWANVDPESYPYPPPSKITHRNIAQLFFDNAADYKTKAFARVRDTEDNTWVIIHWSQAAVQVARLAAYLRDTLKIQHGERVAIFSNTRYEWLIADLAILSIGAISTPIYHSLTAVEAGFIIWDSGAEHVFVENEEQLKKLLELQQNTHEMPATEYSPGGPVKFVLGKIISFEELDPSLQSPQTTSFTELVKSAGQSMSDTEVVRSVHATTESVYREDLASIVYTSGTTGVAKGVIQSHSNHLAMLDAVTLSGLMGSGDGVFLFLPLAHSFARLIAYCPVASAGTLIFPTVIDKKTSRFDAKQVLRDLRDSNPLIFPSVPRVFEKVMTGLTSDQPKDRREKLARWAVSNYRQLRTKKSRGETLALSDRAKLAVADAVVTKVRNSIFGHSLRYAISGGAPISLEVLEFFDSIGVLILEGYGLTETTPAISANTQKFKKFGTVGRLFEGVEVSISTEDGEISARGGNIALGYWRSPQATSASWNTEGWFATGDIGELDSEGFLKITDRKKDLIVNAGGKKIPPAMVEGRIKDSPYISQVMIFGDKKPYIVALVTLEEENVRRWGLASGAVSQGDTSPLVDNPKVIELISREIKSFGKDFAHYEQIQKFKILPAEFTVENGLLTPSLKPKRKAICERYASEIDQLYK